MKDRIGTLQRKLAEGGLDAALLFYSRDILYYTGTAQPSCLAVTPNDYRLFVRSGFDFAVEDVFIGRERLVQERRLEKILPCALLRMGVKPEKIGTELDILTAEQFDALRKVCPDVHFINISPVTLEQRKVKEPGEIEKLRRACEAVHAGHEAVLSTLHEGVTELELSAAVENAHRLAGHEGTIFLRQPDFFMSRGPMGAGPNLTRISGIIYSITGVGLSPAVPAGPSRRPISRGEMVIVDIPTCVEGYHADQTRTYCFGDPGEEFRTLYEDLRAIADDLIDHLKPGVSGGDLCRRAFELSRNLGREKEFQSLGKGKFSRLIGHGVGLECNEPPILSESDTSAIPEGCVVTLELHMMIQELGVIKLEDMIHVRSGGGEILTMTPRQLFAV